MVKIEGTPFCKNGTWSLPQAGIVISGFKDEIISLKSSCFCRKPQPGLFLEAAFKRNIDLNKSIMIGDSWRDKKASEEINLKFIDAATFD